PNVPFLCDEDRATITRLHEEALWFAFQEDTQDLIEESLRKLWQTALRISFDGGLEVGKAGEIVRAQRVKERELEEERIWGFNIGWKLAAEKSAPKASKESVPGPSLPCLAVFSTIATQTDASLSPPFPDILHDESHAPRTLPIPTVSTQTKPLIPSPSIQPIPNSPAPSSPPSGPMDDKDFDIGADDWHDTLELPLDPPPSSFVRDFSGLRSGTSRPFASLQRQHKRGPRVSLPHSLFPPFIPTPSSRSSTTFDGNPHLDWGRDPRLRDLGYALTALGWVRPG
ncbi:hypothetical protein K438DRAFT_1873451, partial [Mycena galopus ATCC 62051]